jgi:hypothetical protein
LAGELLQFATTDEPAPAPPPAPAAERHPPARPASELLAEVAAALGGESLDDDGDAPGAAADPTDADAFPEGSWLDTPAGPATAGPVFTASKPTETVSAADARPRGRALPRPAAPPPPDALAGAAPTTPDAAPEPPGNAWGASTQEIAEELLKAVDEEKRGLPDSSEDDLAALLSAAIATSPERELPRRGGTAGPPADPSQVPAGDFRAVAAGLIAELEASLADHASAREEHP